MALSEYGQEADMTRGLPQRHLSQVRRISDRGYSNDPSEAFLKLCTELEKEIKVNHQGAEILSGSVPIPVGQELFSATKQSEKLKFRIPVDSDLVYSDLSTVKAKVGIKGEGNRVDPKIRSTEEADAAQLPLAPLFKNCDFEVTVTMKNLERDIPASSLSDGSTRSPKPHQPQELQQQEEVLSLREHIRNNLCPTAATVKCVPYKLLFYNPGDFFDIHVDTMHHPDQFGSLSLEIPLLNNIFDWEEEPTTRNDYDKDSLSTEGRGGELVFYSTTASKRPIAAATNNNPQPQKDEEQQDYDWNERELRNIPRHYYRSSDSSSDKAYRSDQVRGITRVQLTSDTPSAAAFRQTTYLTSDIIRRSSSSGGMTKKSSSTSNGDDDQNSPPAKKKENEGDESSRRDEYPPLLNNSLVHAKFAAWLGDIPHEVRPVVKGLRLVLTYNLIKVGNRQLYIPRAPKIRHLADEIFKLLPHASSKGGPLVEAMFSSSSSIVVEALGFQLKHAYTPGGFSTTKNLKGIDAVVYQALSNKYQCYLQMGTEMKCELPDRCYVCYGAGKSKVQIAGLPQLSFEELQGTSLRDLMPSKTTLGAVSGCAWIELGHGVLLGGGAIYGNADVGSDWWYRTCLMVVTQEPSRWQRRRPLFLIREKSAVHRSSATAGEEVPMAIVLALRITELLEQIAKFL